MASDSVVVATGIWFSAGSSRSVPAHMLWLRGDVKIVDYDHTPLAGAISSDLTISARIGSIPRLITFPDGSVFETSDNAAIDRWSTQELGQRRGLVHRLEHFGPKLAVVVAAVALLMIVVWRLAVPAVVDVAVWATPDFVPVAMSRALLETLDGTVLDTSAQLDADKALILSEFQELKRHALRGEAGYRLHFRHGGLMDVNAFALPDGQIVITDELLELSKDDRQAILAVLAHEIGHVDRQHGLRQLYRTAGMLGIFMMLTGDIGSLAEQVVSQGGVIVALSYSREAEDEADRYAIDLMKRAGYDGLALSRFLRMFADDRSGPEWLSTHPDTKKRLDAAQIYAVQQR
ncbi:M48 family metallopeptidase [Rhizobium sp. CFBP 8762]|uniref:M48 family metallopeptidase n=1 Tax=Rhizobium sp. CFBP 8762 TaxID=2775279 RepID=UPI00177FFD2E|nr:M48 family metallopeptidase [Rhizobium sp. CFBP 8762]MBD8553402.1 M48 family metallopeptidase [Rhizobium sp. CFBP 8762]